MVFTSPVFLFLFLPFTLIMYFLLKKEYRNAFLFIMSSAFYYYGEQKMLWLMYFVILTNYLTGLLIERINIKREKEFAKFLVSRITGIEESKAL